jgi:RNA polymerase sigma factor (sigma-70 family)
LLKDKAKEPSVAIEPDRQYEKQELIGRIRKVMAELPPRDQVMLNLYQDRRSYDEIAEIIGVKRSSVGTLLSRALAQLRIPEITGVKP